MDNPIIIQHNFDAKQFSKLFAMYTYGCKPYDHCNRCLKKYFSKKFNSKNPFFNEETNLELNEYSDKNWDAIYVCGVRKGYWSDKKEQVYPHNVHFAIIPAVGKTDLWEFENWKVTVQNGVIEQVPSESQLDKRFSDFPKECTTCRIYRWAVTHYKNQLDGLDIEETRRDAEIHVSNHQKSVKMRLEKIKKI